MGTDSVYSKSLKHFINTRSLTETKVVAAGNVMPPLQWIRYFMESQDVKGVKHELTQDNISAQHLEINEKLSSGKRTKHMNVRYFFISDRGAAVDLTVTDRHADEMLADYFTKTLQGLNFLYFSAKIMGFYTINVLATEIVTWADVVNMRSEEKKSTLRMQPLSPRSVLEILENK